MYDKKNYATFEKESLAIFWAVSRFKTYLLGKWFTVKSSDHKPLLNLRSKKAWTESKWALEEVVSGVGSV